MSYSADKEDNIPIIKIVVIGESGVGKSNFISRYVHDRFSVGIASTIGSEVDSKIITLNSNTDQLRINLHIWDTAGQQRFRCLNKTFYRNALGALVLFDLSNRQSFNRIGKWIEQIRAEVSESCVLLLIGNKSDIKNHEVTVQEATSFAKQNKLGYLQASAALNINVAQAFQSLTQKICKIENIRSNKQSKTKSSDKQSNSIQNPKQKSIMISLHEHQKAKQKKKACC